MSTRSDLSQEIATISAEVTNDLAKKLAKAAKSAEALAREDAVPLKFTGVVRDYRYASGKKGEMPTHRFQLECGKGLWLFVATTSKYFDQFMQDMDMGEKPAKELNGKVIEVQREAGQNMLIPIKFVGDLLVGTDYESKMLWIGAKVRLVNNPALTGTVLSQTEPPNNFLVLDGVEGYEAGGYTVETSGVIRID